MERKGPSPHFNQHQQGHGSMQRVQRSNIITKLKWWRQKSSGYKHVTRFPDYAHKVLDTMAA
jgi:hypothetical protein